MYSSPSSNSSQQSDKELKTSLPQLCGSHGSQHYAWIAYDDQGKLQTTIKIVVMQLIKYAEGKNNRV